MLHECMLTFGVPLVYFRVDTTRIEYSIPLRENWALPYFACQVAALTGYLKRNLNTYAEVRHRSVLYITANSDARLVLMLCKCGTCFVCFETKISCSPVWLQTHYVAEARP